ncbi:MAG: glycogen/starch synthase [Bacteroidota bacterium]
MRKARVLFVTEEITPYMADSHISEIGRYLPQGIQERCMEIRTFMPRYGNINERRNQLHEVIRLSGMNLIINENDHPLIIKVASIQTARLQTYFIDNEDYFQRKFEFRDKNGVFFPDNDERAIFYCRGVIETVKKLGWSPDVIHCHGWVSSLIPIYIKLAFKDNPLFSDCKIITSIYEEEFEGELDKDFYNKVKLPGITNKDVKHLKNPSYVNLMKLAIDFSDAVVIGSPTIPEEITDYLTLQDKNVLSYYPLEKLVGQVHGFYEDILINESVLSD